MSRVPVYQDKYGEPDGNCLAACLATLMQVPITSLDAFQLVYKGSADSPQEWWDALTRWAADFDMLPVFVQNKHHGTNTPGLVRIPKRECVLLLKWDGNSHAVLAQNGLVTHDPDSRMDAHTPNITSEVVVGAISFIPGCSVFVSGDVLTSPGGEVKTEDIPEPEPQGVVLPKKKATRKKRSLLKKEKTEDDDEDA